MPQMSPIMWFSLFISFSIAMIMFNQMNFFSYKINSSLMTEKKNIFKKMNPIENDNKFILNLWSIN